MSRKDASVLDHTECGHGVVVLNPARQLGVRTSQMVSASAWPDMPGNKNSKPQGHSGTQRKREVRAHGGMQDL